MNKEPNPFNTFNINLTLTHTHTLTLSLPPSPLSLPFFLPATQPHTDSPTYPLTVCPPALIQTHTHQPTHGAYTH